MMRAASLHFVHNKMPQTADGVDDELSCFSCHWKGGNIQAIQRFATDNIVLSIASLLPCFTYCFDFWTLFHDIPSGCWQNDSRFSILLTFHEPFFLHLVAKHYFLALIIVNLCSLLLLPDLSSTAVISFCSSLDMLACCMNSLVWYEGYN